jgi:transcriptional regulator with XRE-family HTH domain
MLFMTLIGERLKSFRETLGLTQQQMAAETKISRTYISTVEAGRQEPSFSFIKTLSTSFNLSTDWLLTGEGKMFSKPMTGEDEAVDSPGEEIMEAVNEDPMIASIVRMLADMPPEKRQAAYDYVSEKKHLADLEKTVEALVAERTG